MSFSAYSLIDTALWPIGLKAFRKTGKDGRLMSCIT